MTNEQKAKAYDEALKWLRDLYPGLHGATKEDAEHYFPELKESEDERIRKILIQLVQDAWDGREPAEVSNESDYFACLSYLEKQKEQKPADEQFPPLEGLDAIKAKYYDDGFKNGFDEGVESVKPAEWSEEDKEMIDHLIEALPMWATGRIAMLPSQADEYVKRLKSLRPQPQMLENWTSEDDEFLADVLGCITLVQTYKACGDLKEFKMEHTGEELRSFVRSLKSRPRKQPQWKPSEEQMEALNAINCHGALSYVGQQEHLISLYNDIKKL